MAVWNFLKQTLEEIKAELRGKEVAVIQKPIIPSWWETRQKV
jgi:hypothetical protein